MRSFLLILLICSLSGCGSTPKRDDYTTSVTGNYTISPEESLEVQISNSAKCDFRVHYSSDNSISPNGMMYDGSAGVAGLLAQIAVHAAINSSAQEAKLEENQRIANKYLKPIEGALNGISHEDLIPDDKLFNFSWSDDQEKPKEESANNVLLSQPIFFFSKDLKTLTLKHIVKVHNKGERDPKYQNMVEVISVADTADPKAFWSNTQDKFLLNKVKALYRDSLNIVYKELTGELNNEVTQKNHRINTGEKFRVERGSEVLLTCQHKVIRNLRGWLIAIPSNTPEQCKA